MRRDARKEGPSVKSSGGPGLSGWGLLSGPLLLVGMTRLEKDRAQLRHACDLYPSSPHLRIQAHYQGFLPIDSTLGVASR